MKNKDADWRLYFLLVPLSTAWVSARALTNERAGQLPLIILFSIIGAGVGYFAYRLVANKNNTAKWVAISTVFVLMVTVPVAISFSAKRRSETCPVCGYITLQDNEETCGVCLVEFTQEQMQEAKYATMEEFLKREQISQFMPDSLGQPVEFFEPEELEGFRKDKKWKPSVTEQEVLVFQKGYFDYLKATRKPKIKIEKTNDDNGK